MNKKLNVSASPHVRSKDTTSSIMRDVVIAMIPAAVVGIVNAFVNMGTSVGINAILIIAVSIAASVLAEYVYEKGMKKPITIGDYSAVVTGLILALNMPPYIAPWIPALGCVFAIIIVKQLYGGLGQNFMNPALGGRCFLLIAFAADMTNFNAGRYEAYSGATPLGMIRNEGLSSVNVMDMLTGKIPGTIGETSMVAIVIGACFLLLTGVIDLKVPGSYLV